MKKINFLFLFLVLSFCLQAKTIYYVKAHGTGAGTSWAEASGDIQAMINKAKSGDEVWVAKGTYYPTTETIARDARSRTFLIKEGVSTYGGFAGTETAISQRALADLDLNGRIDSCELVNTTLLSGDIDGVADVWTKTTNANGVTWKWTVTGNEGNCYRVVTASGKIDGFSVTGGNSNGSGGGIYSSSSVTNCTVSNCSANSDGGGIYSSSSSSSSAYVTNCAVSNCSANSGGGIYSSYENVKNCAASNNKTNSTIGHGISSNIPSSCISPDINIAYKRPTTFIGLATNDAQKAELLTADWRLKEDSPCINSGTSDLSYINANILKGNDLEGNVRVGYGAIDIGAYEYIVPSILLPLEETFNNWTDFDKSTVFYNSRTIKGGGNPKWTVENQKALFSWQTNLYSYNEPFFTYTIDASNAAKVYLRYDMYFQAYAGTISPLGTEKLNVEFSTDLITWRTIATYTNANGTIGNNNYKHNISTLAGGKKFFIRFNANGANSNRIEKWEIDNVIVDTDGLFTSVHTAQADKYTYVVSNGELVISNLEQSANIQLFDVNGKLMNSSKTEAQTFHFTLPAHGVYMVKVISNNNTETKKIVW